MNKISWLSAHLEGFVKPLLGYVPKLPKDYTRFFSPQEMSVIKNMWRTVKRESVNRKQPLLLAGRDVFVFEILARREGFPTTFRPDISRHTVRYIKENYSDHFLFDTGFMGSIPKGLSIGNYTMASSFGGVSNRELLRRDLHQVFPRMKGARSLALKIERTPKYWRAGYMRPGYVKQFAMDDCPETLILQDLNKPDEILRAAHLTIEVYTDSSPRFSEGQLPMPAKEKHSPWCWWEI